MDPNKMTQIAVPVRPHQYPALDSILVEADAAYSATVKAIEEGLHGILGRARGIAKGDRLYIVVGGGDTLMKGMDALRKAGVPGTAKRDAVQRPGSRGAFKWYRDSHGNVRYGDRPSPRFHTELSPEEEEALFRNVYQFYESAGGESGVHEALESSSAGINKTDLKALEIIRDYISEFGGDIPQVFMEELSCRNKDQAMNAFNLLNAKIGVALQDPEVQAAMKKAVEERKDYEKSIVEGFAANEKMLGDQIEDWLHGDPEAGAMKLCAEAITCDLFSLPMTRNDFPPGERDNWRNRIGVVRVDDFMFDVLKGQLDEFSPEQKLSLILGAAYAENDEYVKMFTDSLMNEIGEGKSPAELADIYGKIQQRVSEATELFKRFDQNQGGRSVDTLFGDEKLRTDILTGKKSGRQAIDDLKEADRKIAEMCEAALVAQENDQPPEGGFSDKFTGKLSPYQMKFVNWMLAAKRGINAADTGLGKTPMTIAMVDHLIHTGKAERGILVMPPGLLAQWPDEIQKFRPGSETVVIDTDMSAEERLLLLEEINSGRKPCDFLLMSSGVARQYSDDTFAKAGLEFDAMGNLTHGGEKQVIEMEGPDGKKHKIEHQQLTYTQQEAIKLLAEQDPWLHQMKSLKGAMFYDEADSPSQGLKNPSNVSNICAQKTMEGREYGFMLTATPIPNTPVDLYHLMNTIAPGSAGSSLAKFIGRTGVWEYDPNEGKDVLVGYDNLLETFKDIQPYVYSKLKTDPEIAKQMNLPPNTEIADSLVMPSEQAAMYRKAATELFEMYQKGGGSDAGKTFALIHQMRQAAIHPKMIDPNYTGRGVKVDHTVDIVKKHFGDPHNHDHPIVVFCSYTKAFPILREELIASGIDESLIGEYHSGIPTKKRELFKEGANAGKIKVLLVGTGSGGAGLNLQGIKLPDGTPVGPNHMVFLDKPWTPRALIQTKGRIYRRGQEDTVTTHHLRVAGSYDDVVLEKMHKKLQATHLVNAGLGQQGLEAEAQDQTAKLLKDWADGGSMESMFHDMEPAARANMIDNMKGLLGRDDIHASGDEAIANMLGFSLKDPDAQKKRDEIVKMKHEDFMKEHFNVHDFNAQREERTYLQMRGQRIKDRLSINDARLRKKMISQADWAEEKTKLERERKIWESAKSKGRMLSKDESKEVIADNHVFHTKKNPYKSDSENGLIYEMATTGKNKQNPITSVSTFIEKVIPSFTHGMRGKKKAEEEAFWVEAAKKAYKKFQHDGHLGDASVSAKDFLKESTHKKKPKKGKKKTPAKKAGKKKVKKPAAKKKPAKKPTPKKKARGKK